MTGFHGSGPHEGGGGEGEGGGGGAGGGDRNSSDNDENNAGGGDCSGDVVVVPMVVLVIRVEIISSSVSTVPCTIVRKFKQVMRRVRLLLPAILIR